jgi:hypothetical protein
MASPKTGTQLEVSGGFHGHARVIVALSGAAQPTAGTADRRSCLAVARPGQSSSGADARLASAGQSSETSRRVKLPGRDRRSKAQETHGKPRDCRSELQETHGEPRDCRIRTRVCRIKPRENWFQGLINGTRRLISPSMNRLKTTMTRKKATLSLINPSSLLLKIGIALDSRSQTWLSHT